MVVLSTSLHVDYITLKVQSKLMVYIYQVLSIVFVLLRKCCLLRGQVLAFSQNDHAQNDPIVSQHTGKVGPRPNRTSNDQTMEIDLMSEI